MVAPFIGLPLSECSTKLITADAVAVDKLADQGKRHVLMIHCGGSPSHDHAAERYPLPDRAGRTLRAQRR